MRRSFAFAFGLALALASCASSPQRLPVGLSLCTAVTQPGGFAVSVTVQNRSDRPITTLGLSVTFYRDFRYARYSGFARLPKELDPGQKQDVTFAVQGPPGTESGQANSCIVTHIGYMDGTSADLPPQN